MAIAERPLSDAKINVNSQQSFNERSTDAIVAQRTFCGLHGRLGDRRNFDPAKGLRRNAVSSNLSRNAQGTPNERKERPMSAE